MPYDPDLERRLLEGDVAMSEPNPWGLDFDRVLVLAHVTEVDFELGILQVDGRPATDEEREVVATMTAEEAQVAAAVKDFVVAQQALVAELVERVDAASVMAAERRESAGALDGLISEWAETWTDFAILRDAGELPPEVVERAESLAAGMERGVDG